MTTATTFPRLVVGTIALVSGSALGLAFLAQYGFDLCPCLMCHWQRVPYAVTFGLGLLALMPAADPRALRYLIFFCALLFFGNAGLAFFHAGVEYQWWPGLSYCGGGQCSIDLSDLSSVLSNPLPGGCDQAAFRDPVFGLSMASGNVIVCGLMAAFAIWAALQESRWPSQ